MSADDPVLADLVRLLKAMPEAEREFVLSGLSEGECAQLVPLLAPACVPASAGGPALSPALSGLVGRCEAGTPQNLTRRAADELIAAVRQGRSASAAGGGDPSAVHETHFRETLWGRWTGRFVRSRKAIP